VKLYIAVRDDQKDPEKLWEQEYRDLITTAKRSYLCKRENEPPKTAPPTSKPVKQKRRREQTPAAGSRASIAANRPTSVMHHPSPSSEAQVNFAEDDLDDEDAQI
jgi:hypothetical protein